MDSEDTFRKEEKDTLLAALRCFLGDDADRARHSFRHFTPEQMQQPHGFSERSRADILAAYERRESAILRLIHRIETL